LPLDWEHVGDAELLSAIQTAAQDDDDP
jgi:hypothetical protein